MRYIFTCEIYITCSIPSVIHSSKLFSVYIEYTDTVMVLDFVCN